MSQSILQKLEKLFNYEFKVISYQVTEPVHCENELSSNSEGSGGLRKIRKDDNDIGRGNGSGRGGGDDGDAGIDNEKKVILVSSKALSNEKIQKY